MAEQPVSYRFLGPIKRAAGYCTAECDYDLNGVCRNCECLDPARFIVTEYPTREQDAALRLAMNAEKVGGSLSIRPLAAGEKDTTP